MCRQLVNAHLARTSRRRLLSYIQVNRTLYQRQAPTQDSPRAPASSSRPGGGSSGKANVMPPPSRRRHSALAWLALAACVCLAASPVAVQGAVQVADYDPNTDAHGGSLLTPTRGRLLGRTFLWEIPRDPVGVLFMAHGCVHDAADFWPHSKACPQCSGGQPLCEGMHCTRSGDQQSVPIPRPLLLCPCLRHLDLGRRPMQACLRRWRTRSRRCGAATLCWRSIRPTGTP